MKAGLVRLGDVADFVRGITFKPTDLLPNKTSQSIGCMRTKNIQAELTTEDVLFLPSNFIKDKNLLLREGDLLVSIANSRNLVGKACWVPKLQFESTFGGFISALRLCDQQIDKRYFYHWFTSSKVQATLRSYANKTTGISNLNLKRAIELPFPLLQYDEQKRIARIMDLTSSIIANRRNVIAKFDELTRSIFLDFFGDPNKNEKGWNKVKLKYFGNISTGNTPPRSNLKNYDDNFIEWVKTDNIDESSIYVQPSAEYLSKEGVKVGRTVDPGALLVTCIAGSLDSIGRASLVDRKVAFNQQINSIQPNKDVNPLYLYNLFKVSRPYIQSYATSGMKKLLTKGKFEEIVMIQPPIDVQNEYVMVLDCINRIKKSAIIFERENQSLLDSLKQEAFGAGFNV